MANLLPPENITQRRHIQLGRLLLTISLMLALASVVLILAVLPSYIGYAAELRAHDTYLSALDQVRAGVEKEERNQLVYTQKRLEQYKELFAQPSVAQLLQEVLALRPRGMQITSIAYSSRGGVGSISLSGNVERREDVRGFADAVYALQGVVEATIPVQSLVRAEGTFDLVITTDF